MKRLAFLFFFSTFTSINALGLVLYGGDNSANTSSPSNGAPFANVAQIYTGGNLTGSAVYLGNGYFITANHVITDTNSTQITFDGNAYYDIASYYVPTQVGGADIKLFYVSDENATLSLQGCSIYAKSFTTQVPVTLIGGGVGRNSTSQIGDNPIAWGNSSTADIRWELTIFTEQGMPL